MKVETIFFITLNVMAFIFLIVAFFVRPFFKQNKPTKLANANASGVPAGNVGGSAIESHPVRNASDDPIDSDRFGNVDSGAGNVGGSAIGVNPTNVSEDPLKKLNMRLVYMTIAAVLCVVLVIIFQATKINSKSFTIYLLFLIALNVYLLILIIYMGVLKNNPSAISDSVGLKVSWNASPYLIIVGFLILMTSNGLEIMLNMYDNHFLIGSFLNE